MTCPKCPSSPWEVPRGLKIGDLIKKVCCGRTATYGSHK